MVIRLATSADIPLIRQRLEELLHPPYYPDDQDIQDLIDTEAFMVDDAIGAISDWARSDTHTMIRGRYVLPASLTVEQMVVLLRDTWRECVRRWPDTVDWRLEGEFEEDSLPKLRAWRRALTKDKDGPVLDTNADGVTCISWVLGLALARVEELSSG